jgi:hypothetical protein
MIVLVLVLENGYSRDSRGNLIAAGLFLGPAAVISLPRTTTSTRTNQQPARTQRTATRAAVVGLGFDTDIDTTDQIGVPDCSPDKPGFSE